MQIETNNCAHAIDAEVIEEMQIEWNAISGKWYSDILEYDDNSGFYTHCPICGELHQIS